MRWPYHFIDLTDDQKQQRRESLDTFANVAQLSAFVPLFVVCLAIQLPRLNRRWQTQTCQKDFDPPSSPHLKNGSVRPSYGLRIWAASYRKVQWWLGEEHRLGDVESSRGEAMFTLTWLVWLFWLCFVQTGDDYLHLTKRFGIIAASQLPCNYLLAIKSPYSPLQYLTGKSHETLNVYHQLLGKTIPFLLYIHVILYLNFYVQKSLLISKLQERYVLCGIIAIIALQFISLSPIKHRSYRIFYTIHIILASLLLPLLFFHVSHLRIYLYESGAIYLCHTLLRSYATSTVSGTIKTIPTGTGHDNLLEIAVHIARLTTTAFQPILAYRTAQHTYLSLPASPFARSVNSNPFTVASLPGRHQHLRFYARVHAGNTGALAAAASHNPLQELSLTIEGPYGLTTHPDTLLTYDRILFVAGGIGAAFVVPLYRQLLADLSPSPGSYRRERVRFIWAVRSAEETAWALPATEEKDQEGLWERAEVYVTGGAETGSGSVRKDGEGETIELQERAGLLSSSNHYQQDRGDSEAKSRFHTGRPDLHAIVDETFSHSASERVAVVVCGPKSLSRALRLEVGRWVMAKGREVWFWDESFGT